MSGTLINQENTEIYIFCFEDNFYPVNIAHHFFIERKEITFTQLITFDRILYEKTLEHETARVSYLNAVLKMGGNYILFTLYSYF